MSMTQALVGWGGADLGSAPSDLARRQARTMLTDHSTSIYKLAYIGYSELFT
jgi:hypothetical protein